MLSEPAGLWQIRFDKTVFSLVHQGIEVDTTILEPDTIRILVNPRIDDHNIRGKIRQLALSEEKQMANAP